MPDPVALSFFALAQTIYGASRELDGWRDALGRLAEVLGCERPLLFRLVGAEQPAEGVDFEATAAFEASSGRLVDSLPEWKRALWNGPSGVYALDDLIPYRRLLRSELYRRWMRPQRLRWCVQLVARPEEHERVVLALFRHSRQGPFRDHDRFFLARLVLCLEDVLRTRRRVMRTELERNAVVEVLDQVPLGVILLDECGRVLLANRRATRLLRAGDGLANGSEGMRAEAVDEAQGLREAIRELAHREGPPFRSLSLSRSSGRGPLSVRLAGLAGASAEGSSGRPAVVAYVSDLEQQSHLPGTRLQTLYDLTPAEARVASMIARGTSPRQIAAELKLSRHTVRNQLKSVFAKTGTSRQGELISMLLCSTAAPGAEPGAEGSA